MYESLVGQRVDKTNADFADFPDAFDGQIYVEGDASTGWCMQTIDIRTALEKEADRVTSITNKATEIIEVEYSPLKQRKLMSIVIALKDKRDDLGVTLTVEEESMLQANRDVNTWITAIRNIENTAIANGTALDAIVWTV